VEISRRYCTYYEGAFPRRGRRAHKAEKDADIVLIDTPPGMPEVGYQAALAADQRMALGLRGDRFLQFLLHRRLQQPGGGPFISDCFG
jgi:cellulose biosynthesis protein BcsQ